MRYDSSKFIPAQQQSIHLVDLGTLNINSIVKVRSMEDKQLEEQLQALFAEGKAFPDRRRKINNAIARLLEKNKFSLAKSRSNSLCFDEGWFLLMEHLWSNMWEIRPGSRTESAYCDSDKIVNRLRLTFRHRIDDEEIKQRGYVEPDKPSSNDISNADKLKQEFNRLNKLKPKSLDVPLGEDGTTTLGDSLSARSNDEQLESLKLLIQQDPSGELRNLTMINEDKIQINAQKCLLLALDGYNWTEIKVKLNLNYSTFMTRFKPSMLALIKRLYNES